MPNCHLCILAFCRALPRACPNDSCLSQHVQVRKEVLATRSGPKAKQVSWTRSQNQSTNTENKSCVNDISLAEQIKTGLTSTSICLPACLCPAVGSILRTCDKPLCREWRQSQRETFEQIFAFRFDRHMTIQPTEGATWGPQFHHVSIVRFKHKPLALGTHKEAGKCYIYNCMYPKQFHYTKLHRFIELLRTNMQ